MKAAGPKDAPFKTLNIVNVFTLFKTRYPENHTLTQQRRRIPFIDRRVRFIRIPELVETGLGEYFTCEIQESWALESGILLKDYGIPPTGGIQNPISTGKD